MNLLDTSAVVRMIRERKFTPGIITPITLVEVLRGIEEKKRPRVKTLLEESFRLLNLDNTTIETYCVLYQKLKKDGATLSDADLLIAAAAMAHELILVTGDRHFQTLKQMGLKIE